MYLPLQYASQAKVHKSNLALQRILHSTTRTEAFRITMVLGFRGMTLAHFMRHGRHLRWCFKATAM
jgi:hypothetical protein